MITTFYQRATQMGHNIAALQAGAEIHTTLTVTDVDQLKAILDTGAPPEERQELSHALFGQALLTDPLQDESEAGILRRVQDYVFGNAPLHPADRERIKAAFPVKVATLSALTKTVTGAWDLGTSGTIVSINIGTLTMEDGSYITIQNTQLDFTADSLVRNGAPPQNYGDFNILGATGTTGKVGVQNGPGGGGGPGTPGAGGGTGGTGNNGGPGDTGGAGQPSKAANISIPKGFTGAAKLIILSRSGTGGAGGTGGTGAQGGTGGRGGDGESWGCSGSNGGAGGTGGVGGNGGTGGAGGLAVNADGDIRVSVPQAQSNNILKVTAQVPSGPGGRGGAAAAGGPGGGASNGGKNHSGGGAGPTGGPGSQGNTGGSSDQKGDPAKINVKPL